MASDETAARTLREAMLVAADAVIDFAGPNYGPRGATKLIAHEDGSILVLSSGASALRDAGIKHPDLQPYLDLAGAVQEHGGDQATGAVLLAAHLVRNACKAETGIGVPPAAFLDGYALALRQARAALGAMAEKDAAGKALHSVLPGRPGLVPLVARGLAQLVRDEKGAAAIPLDAVDIVADVGQQEEAWLPGLVIRPKEPPTTLPPAGVENGPISVLLLTDDWKPGPWKEGLSYRMTAAHSLSSWSAGEDSLRAEALAKLQALKIGLVVCHREVEAGLADLCRSAGIIIWNDAPESALRRIERATGAKPVARLMHATASDLGRGTVTRRPRRSGGFLLAGDGPSATLCVPGQTESLRAQAHDEAERLIRAAGTWLTDLQAVPGGGRWQRELARTIGAAADAGPGKTPIALRAAADALDALADTLVHNLGGDPLSTKVPADAAAVRDVSACVRVAVVGAFEMAIQMLRIDDRFAKKPSSTAGLRGGVGKPMNVREMAGDIPPLM